MCSFADLILAIGLAKVLDDVARLEKTLGTLLGGGLNEEKHHHSSALFNELFPAWASLGDVVQQVRDLEFCQRLAHQAAMRRGFIAVELDGGRFQFHIPDSLLSPYARKATDERGEEAGQTSEGHAQDEGHISGSIVVEEIWHDVPGTIESPIGVVVDQQRKLLLSTDLHGLLAEPLATFRTGQDDALKVKPAQCFAHEPAVRIAFVLIELEVLGGSGTKRLLYFEAREESDYRSESCGQQRETRNEAQQSGADPRCGFLLALLLVFLLL